MKMTMHINEELLDRVMRDHALASKTAAVEFALNELDRRSRQRTLFKKGLGLTPQELRNAVDPDYDVMAMRVAEKSTTYGKRRSRR